MKEIMKATILRDYSGALGVSSLPYLDVFFCRKEPLI